jgi:hypothetical protein
MLLRSLSYDEDFCKAIRDGIRDKKFGDTRLRSIPKGGEIYVQWNLVVTKLEI